MSTFNEAFPNSTKIYVDGLLGVRVPMREIALGSASVNSGEEPPLRVYDTSGPQDYTVEDGLPKLRAPWVGCRRNDPCVSRLHYARKGEITPEMGFVAIREGMPAEFVRDGTARGGATRPAKS